MAIYKAFALTGHLADWHNPPGAALGYELLPFQGVLLVSITALGYELGPSARACPREILVMFNFMSTKAFVLTPLTPLTPLLLRVRQESGNDAEQGQEGAYLEDELDAGLVC